ncbi:MAG: hypothetical protein U9P14_05660 [Gemmatimonadota bacterium]|nr:hypothetical protein [Gemmatimonadota bacterium]
MDNPTRSYLIEDFIYKVGKYKVFGDPKVKDLFHWIDEEEQHIKMRSSIINHDESPVHGIVNELEQLFGYLLERHGDILKRLIGKWVRFILDKQGFEPIRKKDGDYIRVPIKKTCSKHIRRSVKYRKRSTPF